MNAKHDMDSIARQRKRLSIDYQDLTQTKLNAHRGDRPSIPRVFFTGFTKLRRQFLPHYFDRPPSWRVWIRQFAKERVLPDFCMVGTPKSGTSDLALTIMSHPYVLHPLVKEFYFQDPLAWRQYYPTRRAVQRHAKIHGVAFCPLVAPCLHYLDIATRLSAIRPSTKVIINLRNPVDLVYSQWKWTLLHRDRRYIDELPFLATFSGFVDTALALFPGVQAPFGVALHYGIYAASVSHWLRSFGDRNVCVFDIADYFSDRSAYFYRLEEFVSLPHVSLPSRLPVSNRNPLGLPKLDQKASDKLKEFFEPYNRQLWDVIGTSFSW